MLAFYLGPTPSIAVAETVDSTITRLAKEYQVDELLARKIMWCESRNKPDEKNINKNGTVDYSYWQINSFYWGKEMAELGWDVKNPGHNLEAGFHILSEHGSKPWVWSKKCWSNPKLVMEE